jgi:3-phosphoshikimate 1-carboxyvinyltransferase
MHSLELTPVSRPVQGRIRPPGSKSLTNRALIVAALAEGPSTLTGVLDSVDTQVMIDSLNRLGISVTADYSQNRFEVKGAGGTIPSRTAELWCENSGTSIRFLTALCATGEGEYRLDGNSRMRERPIGPLVEALASLGIAIRCEAGNDCPPVILTANGIPGGRIRVGGDLSSQYLSGLLMAAPAAKGNVTLEVQGELVSRSYVEMTLELMRAFGANVTETAPNCFEVEARPYQGRLYDIEPDASAASYFFGLAAVTGGEVTVEGLHRKALQGDVKFVDALVQMGCEAEWGADFITLRGKSLRGIDIDMNDISDTAQTLACVAVFAEGPTRIRNVAHMRLKETDRVSAVVTELRRCGIQADEHPDGLTIYPGPVQPTEIQTYDDHRMAMSFSLLGVKAPGIRIADPGCTSKTYPLYFQDLEKLCRTAR